MVECYVVVASYQPRISSCIVKNEAAAVWYCAREIFVKLQRSLILN
jgi:hypothetical protein